MIKVAIVEDEQEQRESMTKYLQDYSVEEHVALETTCFNNGLDILDDKEKYDVIFMDIQMPQMDGLTVAKKLREKDSTFILFFITRLGNLAIKGYDAQALDFLVKPLGYSEFKIKFQRAIKVLQKRKNTFTVIADKYGNIHRLMFDDICYVEVKGHAVTLHCSKEDIEVYGTLKDISSKLDKNVFYQINRYYLVNLLYVTKVDIKESLVYISGGGHFKSHVVRRRN